MGDITLNTRGSMESTRVGGPLTSYCHILGVGGESDSGLYLQGEGGRRLLSSI